jgi:hypothetical protein
LGVDRLRVDGDVVDVDGDGFVGGEDGADCEDDNAALNPLASDIAGDDIDQNCDGVDGTDGDLDGFASTTSGGTDCDDHDGDIRPNAAEIWYDNIDQNCDEANDFDQDADGQTSLASGGTDCEDTIVDAYLGATEVWYDGIDQDCDGANDYDQDHDGFSAAAVGGGDCYDQNSSARPGQTGWFGEDRGDGSFDYDCSGVNEKQFPWGSAETCSCGGVECSIWPSSVPGCGRWEASQEFQYSSCLNQNVRCGQCMATQSPRQQLCR